MNEFNLSNSDKIPAKYFEELSKDDLRRALKSIILDLLLNDFQKLTLLLYRHDVPERKAALAFNEPDNERKAEHLADLVIQRELQKVATRRAYRRYKAEKGNK